MKEYKVLEAEQRNAQSVMNSQASWGWEVKATTLGKDGKMIITFERERK